MKSLFVFPLQTIKYWAIGSKMYLLIWLLRMFLNIKKNFTSFKLLRPFQFIVYTNFSAFCDHQLKLYQRKNYFILRKCTSICLNECAKSARHCQYVTISHKNNLGGFTKFLLYFEYKTLVLKTFIAGPGPTGHEK